MKPFLEKGYAKRKLHTGNQSVQFDEEREVERPLFYSTRHLIADPLRTQTGTALPDTLAHLLQAIRADRRSCTAQYCD